jgi:two-component system, chemotaxis family, protein-glutamate methylesterase/glutaminase
MIRVLVVEDSLTMRQYLRASLGGDPELRVVAEAADGAEAVRLCEQLRPDVVTMDIMLPGMDGLAATEQIMAQTPTPILVVSSADRHELFNTYDALAAGAVDVLEKPRGDASDTGWAQRLCHAVRLVSRIRVITHPRATLHARRSAPPTRAVPADQRPLTAIAVGASTGGPAAITRLLGALPRDLDVPVLCVQHIAASEPFAVAFSDWLGSQIDRPVAYARDGQPLAGLGGRVLLAPPDRHLVVDRGVLRLSDAPPRHSCRPAVDALFESVAGDCGAAAAGCLLTGMGRDGAAGLLAMRRAGAVTFAQDEASSVVYGMPREAAALGAAAYVLPPEQIAPRLVALVPVDSLARRR